MSAQQQNPEPVQPKVDNDPIRSGDMALLPPRVLLERYILLQCCVRLLRQNSTSDDVINFDFYNATFDQIENTLDALISHADTLATPDIIGANDNQPRPATGKNMITTDFAIIESLDEAIDSLEVRTKAITGAAIEMLKANSTRDGIQASSILAFVSEQEDVLGWMRDKIKEVLNAIPDDPDTE